MNFSITTDVGLSFIIKEKAKLKNRLRHKKITSTGMMSPSQGLQLSGLCRLIIMETRVGERTVTYRMQIKATKGPYKLLLSTTCYLTVTQPGEISQFKDMYWKSCQGKRQKDLLVK